MWEVASGVVDELRPGGNDLTPDRTDRGNQEHLADGQAPIIRIPGLNSSSPTPGTSSLSQLNSPIIQASCICGHVQFHITRPDERSRTPKSYFPDLMIPYRVKDPLVCNPDDVKWWLRSGSNGDTSHSDNEACTRYLAGLCACRSCRLTSGFELQSWTFVPRTNIIFPTRSAHTGSSPGDAPASDHPWVEADFDDLHDWDVLKAYASSDGVTREFCPGCGATVFWHDTARPELIDVSVGLLEWGDDGDGLGSWLDWWTERVSFAEESALGRSGVPMANAVAVVDENERRLKGSGHSKAG
jgi:hypothetical protein